MFNDGIKDALEGQIVAMNAIKDAIVSHKTPAYSEDIGARVAELEVKMAKLWGMLTTVTPTGEEKLSKTGKRFGGKSRHLLSS